MQLTLKDRAGIYEGVCAVTKPIKTNVNIKVKVESNGNIHIEFLAKIMFINKVEKFDNKLDPNSSDSTFQINIKDKVFNISFNSNQSINCVLPNSINGVKLKDNNIVLTRV